MEFILGIVVLLLQIWAVVNILQSGETTGSKVLWIALVVLLPVLGVIVWYFAGPKSRA